MIISSKQNEIVKYAINIKQKKYAEKYGECLVESEKLVAQLVSSLSTILVDGKLTEKYSHILNKFKGKVIYITTQIANHIADSVTTSGIFGFVKIPNNVKKKGNFVVLENLQDPSNLGAIIRSARAFGFNNIYCVGGVYPYSYKVIRSSMGYVFDVNIVETKLEDLKGLNIYCADMDGQELSKIKPVGEFGIAIGNEGNGVSDELRNICKNVISIPMQNGVESLNASVCAGIMFYTLSNK